MATQPLQPIAESGDKLQAGAMLEHARGLAELAFGSFSRVTEFTQARHLALLPSESLQLDLNDPAQRQFGDYELLELLGEGGMGVVYRARHIPLEREVAVKLLSAGPWASREFIARFEREAQNAARMQHHNIVTVYEAGSFEGLQFFSMRLVRGESLSAKLKRGDKFEAKTAAAMMRTVAEAVGYAHSLGVLHLDLKPANVLVDEAGTPCVTDFGLARRLENALAVENDEISGTPAYMAPEQAQVRASKLTAATDIWGLGAILYELLTGHPPFRADTAQDTVRLVLEGRVRAPRRWRPSLSPDLEAIVTRCLNRDPAERYSSARALADDLTRYVEDRPVQARPLNMAQRAARWARREPKLATTALLAFGLLAGGLIATTTQWRRADANAHIAQANARTANERLWDSRDQSATRYMESANGWKAAPLLLANISEMEAQGQRVLAESARKRIGIIENANPHLIDVLPAADGTKTLAFSPDGSRLALTLDDMDLRLIDLADGKPLWNLAGASDAYGAGLRSGDVFTQPQHIEFTPDGKTILLSNPMPSRMGTFPFGIFMSRVDARGGQWLAPPPVDAANSRWGFSADGHRAITFDSNTGAQTWVDDPWRALSPLRKLPATEWSGPVLFAPDQRSFAYHALGFHGMGLFDVATLKARWHLDSAVVGQQTAWAFSPDSRWLALGNSNGEVLVVDSATRAIRRLSPHPLTQIRELHFSDDGQWLAAAAGKSGVYLWTWPEGRLLVSPFGAEVQPERVRLDHAHSRILASGTHGSAALWEIPETRFEMDRGDAVPQGDRFSTPATPEGSDVVETPGDGVAWDSGRGLLAHAAAGRVLLERLPSPVLKRVQAAPIKPSTLHFDGKRLVAVAGDQVRLLDALTEKPLRAPFEFPQSPGFAELTNDGRTLAVTAGRMLYAFDVADGKPRFAPVALTNSPQHVELNPDGGSVAIGWLDHDARGMWEVVDLRNLRSGARMAQPLRLPGILGGLVFNPEGTRLLVWNFTRLTVRDARTFAPIPGPLADLRTSQQNSTNNGAWIHAVAFAANDDVRLSVIRMIKSDLDVTELWRYSGNGTRQTVPTQRPLESIVPMADGKLAVVADSGELVLLQRDGAAREFQDVMRDTPRAEAAASADGHWLARAQRNGVVLFDARTNTRITSLRAPLPAPDLVFQLAFSPDGNRLLARSLRNRLMVWNLAPDTRAVPAIARELALRDIATDIGGAQAKSGPTTRERAALRASDPGAPIVPPPSSMPIARLLPNGPIPPRDPHTPSELLDLTPYYTFSYDEVEVAASDSAGDFHWLAPGVQRLLGTDYDLRGVIQLESATGNTDFARGNYPPAVTVPLPRPDVAALNLLLLRSLAGTQRDDRAVRVTLQYADGGTANLWIRAAVDVQSYPNRTDLGTRLRMAAFGYDARAYAKYKRASHIYAVRLANPQPERALRSITFTAMEGSTTADVILAVTIEPYVAAKQPD